MITFLPLGGADEIGANCYYLNINGNGIILDCGMHPRKTGFESLPDFNLIDNLPVDHVLISHAHQDHLSSLPFLVKRHPYIHITTTPQTRAISELTLHNSVSILKKEIGDDENFEMYSHDEVDLLIKTIDYKAYNEEFVIQGYVQNEQSAVKCTFYDAGHILGSASILLENNRKKIFYTGDINLTNQTLISGGNIPTTKVDSLILETTYGATDSSLLNNWEDESLRLAKSINNVLSECGSVLIPVFALGKMQEMLATIWQQMQKGRIAPVDIYTGGIGKKINRIYDYNRYVVNMIDPEFELSNIPVKDINEISDTNDFFKQPCIVLISSGMMIPGTTSFNLAKRWMDHKNSAIFTVGYMDPETPGYKISVSKCGDKIQLDKFSEPKLVKCEINNFRFSAHAKREDLVALVKKLKPESVILVHGDSEAIDWVGAAILRSFPGIKVNSAKPGKKIIL
ncbi:MAG TPA: MBL fold metallo-hydrolase [Ignavibacteriaceae bacterium]|nr:MBL fold metallo-hydrolase [Ignavibacteriaceae bacterium]